MWHRAAVAAHLAPITAAAAAAALSRDPFARAHGRAALRFHASSARYLVLIVGVQLAPFLFLVNLILVLNRVQFAIIAVHRAAIGQTFTYPPTIGRT